MGQNPAKQIFEVPSFWQDFILCISEKMCKGRRGSSDTKIKYSFIL